MKYLIIYPQESLRSFMRQFSNCILLHLSFTAIHLNNKKSIDIFEITLDQISYFKRAFFQLSIFGNK